MKTKMKLYNSIQKRNTRRISALDRLKKINVFRGVKHETLTLNQIVVLENRIIMVSPSGRSPKTKNDNSSRAKFRNRGL